MRQDARHSRTKGAANFLSVPSVPHVSRFTGFKRDARTPPRERRVSARRGRAGEMTGFFNSLLARTAAIEHKGHRSVVQQLDLHVRGKDPGFYVSTVVS